MKKRILKFFVLAGIIHFTMIPAFAGEVTVDEDKLREIVKEVIKDNPKLIYESVNAYVRQMQEERETEQLESSFKNRIKDIPINDNTPLKGKKDAPVTIVEYGDFQCPYCSRGNDTVKQVLKEYPEKVRIVFKNNPLDFHKEALPAAKAALAAHKQGKFWEYHDLLFKNSSKLDEETLTKLATDLKLDMEKFNKDRNSDETAKQITDEQAEAEKYGLKGTPTYVVNGVVVRGAKDKDYFLMVIERLLAEDKKQE